MNRHITVRTSAQWEGQQVTCVLLSHGLWRTWLATAQLKPVWDRIECWRRDAPGWGDSWWWVVHSPLEAAAQSAEPLQFLLFLQRAEGQRRGTLLACYGPGTLLQGRHILVALQRSWRAFMPRGTRSLPRRLGSWLEALMFLQPQQC